MKYSKHQPKEGETCLVCPHTEDGITFNFFSLESDQGRGLPVVNRVTGDRLVAHWLVLCDICYRLNHEDPMKGAAGLATWADNEPVIKEASN